MNTKNLTIDVLIIGQGVAGSALAYELHQQNISVYIIDNNQKSAATAVANGQCQRISGQKLGINPTVNECFNMAIDYYKTIEQTFNCSL